MIQNQITNHKSNNFFALVGCTKVLSEVILKFRHLKYRRSDKLMSYVTPLLLAEKENER